MYTVIIVLHVLLGLGIIGLVLMQQGKGADAGAAFGTGSAGSVFGAQGAASFLSRSTAVLATLFFSTSLGLAVVNGHKDLGKDIMATPATEQNSGLPKVEGAKNDTPAVPVPTVPEANKPAETTKSATETKPAEPAKTEEPKPVTEKPVEATKPAETAKPETESKPVEAEKPVEKHKVEEKKPAAKEEHKPAEKHKADSHKDKGKDAKKDH
ncbi:Protein-export membrane protein SecG [Methylococcales bacterium]|nr:Protein-export membrane protein SecG [Methylococcales bacterium]